MAAVATGVENLEEDAEEAAKISVAESSGSMRVRSAIAGASETRVTTAGGCLRLRTVRLAEEWPSQAMIMADLTSFPSIKTQQADSVTDSWSSAAAAAQHELADMRKAIETAEAGLAENKEWLSHLGVDSWRGRTRRGVLVLDLLADQRILDSRIDM